MGSTEQRATPGWIAAMVVLAGCAATRPRGANELGLSSDTTGLDLAALAGLAEASLGTSAQGPARVERVVRWRPRAAQPLVLWVTCRGTGDARACVISVARLAEGGIAMMGSEAVGWSPPTLGEVSAEEVVMSGTDGRGTWREQLRFSDDRGGTVSFTRRFYDNGTF